MLLPTLELALSDDTEEDGERRYVHGVLCRVQIVGAAHDHGATWLKFRLHPAIWQASLRKTRRIFQDLFVQELANRLLEPYRLRRRWVLDQAMSPIGYCVRIRRNRS